MKKYLDAINIMLQTIGERPLETIEQVSDSYEATIADSVLEEVKLEVLAQGWRFNTDYNWKMSPDTSGYIAVASNNILVIDPTDRRQDYILKDSKLYDRGNQTYKFTSPVACDITWNVEFDDIPYPVQYYITIRAARKYQARFIGDPTQHNYTLQDEMDAKRTLMMYESDTGDYSIFDSYSSFKVIDRRFNPLSIGG